MKQAGILLPITALPSDYGVGTLGKAAFSFVDFLKRAGMTIWQVLPLLPTGYGDSPYQACAADALNYYLVDLDLLCEEGLLEKADYADFVWGDDPSHVDYERLFSGRVRVLRRAFARFDRKNKAWQAFLDEGKYADFAVFMSLKNRFGYLAWRDWQREYRDYDEKLIGEYAKENAEEIEFWQFTQYLFLRQWRALKAYANARGIELMGDMPIYLAEDSVEAWKERRKLFLTDEDGEFSVVAGVPPDAFSDEGQLWGNPVYDWEKMKKDDYAWWKARIDDAFSLFDIVRIDHFRGFDRFYAIPAGATTAKAGEWLDGPKAELFVGRENLKIVAEDLGIIDDGVRTLLRKTGYPGMKVLEFAFDGNPENEYKPSRFQNGNCAAYTGTHDNLPLRGHIESLSSEARRAFEDALEAECGLLGVRYIGRTARTLTQTAVRLLLASKADRVILPMHDVLALGENARINFPSTLSKENWSYRFSREDFSGRVAAWLKKYAKRSGRFGDEA